MRKRKSEASAEVLILMGNRNRKVIAISNRGRKIRSVKAQRNVVNPALAWERTGHSLEAAMEKAF